MTIQNMEDRMEMISQSRPWISPEDQAVPTKMALLLAEAANSHLRQGDVEAATLCFTEAEYWLSVVRECLAEEQSI